MAQLVGFNLRFQPTFPLVSGPLFSTIAAVYLLFVKHLETTIREDRCGFLVL